MAKRGFDTRHLTALACLVVSGCAASRGSSSTAPTLTRAAPRPSITAVHSTAAPSVAACRPGASPSVDARVTSLLAKVGPSVVQLRAPIPARSARPALRVVSGTTFDVSRAGPLGTGVLVAPRLVLTAGHVIEHARELRARTHDRRDVAASVLLRETSLDLALVKLGPEASDLPAVALDEGRAPPGTWAVVVGHLLGTRPTVTLGVVTAAEPLEPGAGTALEIDAAVNLLNTGGPILDLDGALLSIASAKQTEARGMRGLGYGTPASLVSALVPSAAVGDSPLRKPPSREQNPLRGIATEDLDAKQRARFDVREDVRNGAVVTDVECGSPAAEVGLEVGDVVVEVDFEPVWSADAFRDAAADAAGPEMLLLVRGHTATYVLLHP